MDCPLCSSKLAHYKLLFSNVQQLNFETKDNFVEDSNIVVAM